MRVIVVGFGTVARSFLEIVKDRLEWLRQRYGFAPQIVAILDSGGAMMDQAGIKLEEALATRRSEGTVAAHNSLGHRKMNAFDVIGSAEADVLLELTPTKMPDGQPALGYIESAIKKGLNVVTTNKGPLAAAMPALLELAQYQRVLLRFSGTVGGGTPILDFAKNCLNGDRIQSIEGILNGTTNYILTRMFDSGIAMDEALSEAQKAGYAEADPTYDVGGLDTAGKLVIMSNWILGRRVSIRDVDIEGITNVTIQEVQKAKESGDAIKLVALADGSELSVRPRPVAISNPLVVKGSLNAVTFRTEVAGDITLVGRGAGGRETAGAVLRDLIEVRKTLLK